MTVLNWILLCIIVLCFGIYIFSSIIQMNILRKISGCLILPSAGILNIQFLLNYLPDSKFIIYFSFIALVFAVLTESFYIFKEKEWCQKLMKACAFFISFVFAQLYKSVLFIIDVPLWFIIVFFAIYFVILFFLFVLSGRKKFLQYISFSLIYLQTALLNFLSLVYLCFITRLQSVLLFFGTFLFFILVCFYFVFDSEKKFKLQNVFYFALFLISQCLIIYSNIFLINQ